MDPVAANNTAIRDIAKMMANMPDETLRKAARNKVIRDYCNDPARKTERKFVVAYPFVTSAVYGAVSEGTALTKTKIGLGLLKSFGLFFVGSMLFDKVMSKIVGKSKKANDYIQEHPSQATALATIGSITAGFAGVKGGNKLIELAKPLAGKFAKKINKINAVKTVKGAAESALTRVKSTADDALKYIAAKKPVQAVKNTFRRVTSGTILKDAASIVKRVAPLAVEIAAVAFITKKIMDISQVKRDEQKTYEDLKNIKNESIKHCSENVCEASEGAQPAQIEAVQADEVIDAEVIQTEDTQD